MKVKDLFEQYSDSVDVAVEYELEVTLPNGDVDYRTLEIAGEVIITPDMYGTGDSPTDYEFNVTSIIDKDTGDRVAKQDIPKDGWTWIEKQAIEQVNRRR